MSPQKKKDQNINANTNANSDESSIIIDDDINAAEDFNLEKEEEALQITLEESSTTSSENHNARYVKRISSNLLLRDNLSTIDSRERSWLEKYNLSERRIDNVLGSRRVIRCGLATLAYYQMFDSLLSRKISRDYRQLGAIMQNTPYIKSVLTAVLSAIPVRSGLRNQGYLKSHMNLQRAFIQADLERIISHSFVVSDTDRNDTLSSSLSWIIQTILMYQFAKNHLIDYSELSISNMTSVDEYVIDYSDIYQFRDYILSEYVHEGIMRISRLSESVTTAIQSVDDEPSSRGIEMSFIIQDSMKIINEISDYLLILEQRKNTFFTLLNIMRIYRDRSVLQQIPSFNEIMSCVINFVDKNSRFFETYIHNYEFNLWMDSIEENNLSAMKKVVMSQIIGNEHMLTDIMIHMDKVLREDKSLIRLYSKEEFIKQFNILIKKDEYLDKPKHCFISRRIGQINIPEIYELMIQTERPYQRVVKDISKDVFILIAGKFYNKNAYEMLLDSVTQGLVKSAESSYSSIADIYIPNVMDYVVHQSTQLYKNDLKKLAILQSDSVYVYYESYMRNLLSRYLPDFNNGMILSYIIDKKDAGRGVLQYLQIPICRKKLARVESCHGDIYRDVTGSRFILTREPHRIIEDCDSSLGDSFELINSDMITHPKAFASKRTMQEAFATRMSIIDTNSKYDIIIPRQFSGYGTDMKLVVSTKNLWTPVSDKNWLVVSNNPYKNLVDDYCKALECFKMHLYQLGHNISIDKLISNDENFISRELSGAVKEQYKNFISLSASVKKKITDEALWYHMISSTDRAYEDVLNDIIAFEAGEFERLHDNGYAKSYSVSLSSSSSINKAIQARIKNIFGTMNFNFVCTFQAHFYSHVDSLLRNDDLLKSLTLSMNLKEADTDDETRLEDHLSLLKMFETEKGSSIARMIELSCASIILAMLYSPTLYGGMSENVFGNEVGSSLLKHQSSFMSRLVIQFNAWAYEKFNRSSIKDDLKIIENLNDNSILGYYHNERKEKNYSYEVFDVTNANTKVSDSRDLGSYNLSNAKEDRK